MFYNNLCDWCESPRRQVKCPVWSKVWMYMKTETLDKLQTLTVQTKHQETVLEEEKLKSVTVHKLDCQRHSMFLKMKEIHFYRRKKIWTNRFWSRPTYRIVTSDWLLQFVSRMIYKLYFRRWTRSDHVTQTFHLHVQSQFIPGREHHSVKQHKTGPRSKHPTQPWTKGAPTRGLPQTLFSGRTPDGSLTIVTFFNIKTVAASSQFHQISFDTGEHFGSEYLIWWHLNNILVS